MGKKKIRTMRFNYPKKKTFGRINPREVLDKFHKILNFKYTHLLPSVAANISGLHTL